MQPTKEELGEVLFAIMKELETPPQGGTRGGNGPGHGHTRPGIWDDDNAPEKAGKPCEWCALWHRAVALRAQLQGERAASAQMRRPTITEVRRVVEAHGARQGLVLLCDGKKVAGASYGSTKAECGRMGKLLDALVDGVAAGRLPCP
jgi:hypothetical protein